MKKKRISVAMRQKESYSKAGKYLLEDTKYKKPLSREFKRVPYGLTMKKGEQNE